MYLKELEGGIFKRKPTPPAVPPTDTPRFQKSHKDVCHVDLLRDSSVSEHMIFISDPFWFSRVGARVWA